MCLNLWKSMLDRRFGSTDGCSDSKDEHVKSHAQTTVHAVHPMPLACVAILLLINTIYLVVLLSTSQLAWAGWSASSVSWLMFVSSCWWSWDSLCGASRTSMSCNKGYIEAPIELSELLLPSHNDDADE
jgi:hypothetical protein